MDSREIINLMKLKSCPRRLGLAQAQISQQQIREALQEKKLLKDPFSSSPSHFATRQGVIFEAKITQVEEGEAKTIEKLYQDQTGWIFEKVYSQPIANKSFLEKVMQNHSSAILLSVNKLPLQLTPEGEINYLEADYLIWHNNTWTVGEIKTYSDMASLTDQSKIASATAQSALYAVALNNMGFSVSHFGHLIFQRQQILSSPQKPIEGEGSHDNVGPYYYIKPTLLQVNLEESLRAFNALQIKLKKVKPLDIDQALSSPFQLCSNCQQACPLFEVCQQELTKKGIIWNNQLNLEDLNGETVA